MEDQEMKILLAPAETKVIGGESSTLKEDRDALFFQNNEILDIYDAYVKKCSLLELSQWIGLKNQDECARYKQSIFDTPTMKAIQRYNGVAFEAIDYNNLQTNAQNFIDDHVLIYSNLFGILRADSMIPDYKFKQGATLPHSDCEKYFQKHLKDLLDTYLGDEILDLSAGYYLKFYKPIGKVITFKFLKEGKIVSHYAKYYRGDTVRQIALHQIDSFEKLMNFSFTNLHLVEIQKKGNIQTLIMEIQ